MDQTNDPLSEIQTDLKATTENITADAERLLKIEAEKARLKPGDPRLDALGAEAEALAERMAQTAKVQSALVHAAKDEASGAA